MSESIADLESRVAHARRVHDVAGRVFASVGEDALKARNGRRVIPEAWAYHHAAEALADAEPALALAEARVETTERQRRSEEIERHIMQLLASGPASRELLLSAGPRRAAHEAISNLE